MIFRQIRSKDETGTLSYLLADENSGDAIIIDPNIEDTQGILYLAEELNVRLKYIVDTHTHADHISAAGELKKLTGAKLLMHENTKDKWKVVDQGDKFGIGDILRQNADVEVDRFLKGNEEIKVGPLIFKVLFTPGHTDNHISLLIQDMLFTGDILLIGQAGRSDLPGGNVEDQFESIFNIILKLPEDIKIYPGHDYENNTFAYLSDEKQQNPFLERRTLEQYKEFVADFFPPVSEAVDNGKMTLQCGTKRVSKSAEPFQNISAVDLAEMITRREDMLLLDVREPFELKAFGYVPGVINIPIGEISGRTNELPSNKDKKIVAICQSGNRSYEVAYYLSKKGYTNVYNLDGGTSGWIYNNHPLVNNIKYSGVSK
ncbi:MAG: MBL fold metallo-hydrolase [Ignavibacteriales bacterium]